MAESSTQSVSIGGGIVLFLISLKMIFSPASGGIMGHFQASEPLLVSLAVPLLAGPSTLAMLIQLRSSASERWLMEMVLA